MYSKHENIMSLIMTCKKSCSSFFMRSHNLSNSNEGVAAVEFAIILPVMVALLLGMSDLTIGISTDRKLTQLTRTVADLTSRQNTAITPARLSDIFAASQAVMQPYNSSSVKIRLSSVVVEDTGTVSNGVPVLRAKVCWSRTQGSITPYANNTILTAVPEGFKIANTSYILSEVSMNYTPTFSGLIGNLSLSEEAPWPVRNVKEVTLDTQAACLP
jgi:Flp pilus assembly protein TadG